MSLGHARIHGHTAAHGHSLPRLTPFRLIARTAPPYAPLLLPHARRTYSIHFTHALPFCTLHWALCMPHYHAQCLPHTLVGDTALYHCTAAAHIVATSQPLHIHTCILWCLPRRRALRPRPLHTHLPPALPALPTPPPASLPAASPAARPACCTPPHFVAFDAPRSEPAALARLPTHAHRLMPG